MARVEMEFTGERVVPGKTPEAVYKEHIDRYIFAAGIARDRDVLDVACGTGYGADYLAAAGARKVVGADVSPDAVRYARDWFGQSARASFVCADAVVLPFADCSFDVVVSFETLEHIRAYRKFLAECRRVLREEGLLVCSTPNRRVFSPNLGRPINPFHVKEFWPEEFRRLLNRFFRPVVLYGQCDVTLADNSVERRYGVREFRDDAEVSSGYMIAVAGKRAGSRVR
jgi:SAM-dependent methyltransferase